MDYYAERQLRIPVILETKEGKPAVHAEPERVGFRDPLCQYCARACSVDTVVTKRGLWLSSLKVDPGPIIHSPIATRLRNAIPHEHSGLAVAQRIDYRGHTRTVGDLEHP